MEVGKKGDVIMTDIEEWYYDVETKLKDALREVGISAQKQCELIKQVFDEYGVTDADDNNNKQKRKETKLMNSYYFKINR